jgi:Ser/Thr protein kinase RdoA (MazF antagonist)
MTATLPPYADLTPDRILDALDAVGLRGDGRLLALGSYENRVYQIGIEDGAPVVAKFYRPGRWPDAAIAEEHAFVAELAAREIPVVAPLTLAGATLHTFGGFRFAVYPRCGGRAPELGDRETLEWMGRFLGRIHAVGALAPFRHRPALDLHTFGLEPRDWLLEHDCIPSDLSDAWRSIAAQALDGVRHCWNRAGDVRTLRLHGDCHAGNVLWLEHGVTRGPHFVDFDDARGPPCRTCGCCSPASATRRRASSALCWPVTKISSRSIRASSTSSRHCGRCASSITRRGSPSAGTTLHSPPRSRGSTPSATGRTASSSCASRSR